MGAAFVAFGQALVDAIAVGFVGDDEDTALCGGGRRSDDENTSEERRGESRQGESHGAPIVGRSVCNGGSRRLRMIHLGRDGEDLSGESGRFAALDGKTAVAHGDSHERSPRHLLHLPRDYALAIRWLRLSFLNRDDQDARPAGRDFCMRATCGRASPDRTDVGTTGAKGE